MAVVYSIDQQGGKGGANYAENIMPTLCADSHGTPHAVAYPEGTVPIMDSVGGQAERGWDGTVAPTLKATHYKCPPLIAQAAGFCTEHSAKARGVGYQEEVAPTLRAGVTPAVMYRPTTAECYDARGNGDGQVVNTLTGDHNNRITDYTTVVCLQGNGIDRADTARCNGKGWKEDTSYTLNTIDRPAVVYGTDVGFFNTLENQSPTLLARGYKDPHLVTYPEGEVRYIVRRLIPTECARLQGFADWWAYIPPKNAFTEEEYRFWLEVRNTHAAINGRAVKDYTERQMLTWYDKLYTDSAEYKMWGNGIALPPALYCMQGIVDALEKPTEESEEDAWML
jgi:DNA (cytosine-5)-methyltransferase 1